MSDVPPLAAGGPDVAENQESVRIAPSAAACTPLLLAKGEELLAWVLEIAIFCEPSGIKTLAFTSTAGLAVLSRTVDCGSSTTTPGRGRGERRLLVVPHLRLPLHTSGATAAALAAVDPQGLRSLHSTKLEDDENWATLVALLPSLSSLSSLRLESTGRRLHDSFLSNVVLFRGSPKREVEEPALPAGGRPGRDETKDAPPAASPSSSSPTAPLR